MPPFLTFFLCQQRTFCNNISHCHAPSSTYSTSLSHIMLMYVFSSSNLFFMIWFWPATITFSVSDFNLLYNQVEGVVQPTSSVFTPNWSFKIFIPICPRALFEFDSFSSIPCLFICSLFTVFSNISVLICICSCRYCFLCICAESSSTIKPFPPRPLFS